MKQRDFFYLQELAKEGKIKFINLVQKGEYAIAEATNGFCYMQIAESNIKQFTQGFFSFVGKGTQDDIHLPRGYEIHDSEGEIISQYQYTEPFDIRTGKQGEFTATFKREELLYFLKYFLASWRREDAKKYILIFHRAENVWSLRGVYNNKTKQKDLPIEEQDSVTDTTFRFMVNPHTLRLILKWFECEKVTMYFQNGNYECRSPIFMRDDNKLAVLMPIARKNEVH